MTIPLDDIIVFRNEFLLAGNKFGVIVKGGFAPSGGCDMITCEYNDTGHCQLAYMSDAYLPADPEQRRAGMRICTEYVPVPTALRPGFLEQRNRDALEIAACKLGILLGETK